ncbi:MAG TPA: glycoside hydrolase family 3 N-terminal domain-containing protein [Longimicrobiales bacterium]|nr:glycoside hydrolase family 3 N-terminal domain-containing protein [Longimicrobiales bacterium]
MSDAAGAGRSDDPARLVFPALRWSSSRGFDHEATRIDAAVAAGVGGFCLFGGTIDDAAALIARLRSLSAGPLLFASDMERGAGQQLAGATELPPAGALGSLDDTTVTRQAAAMTARQARAVGIDWILGPVADVALEPCNPIVGTRAFGSHARQVARHVAAWVEGCRSEGVLCCAKHFPGHGRTTGDSHVTLPRVRVSEEDLEVDLLPFRAAVAAGCDALMTAHVIYDAIDAGQPATLSRPVVTGVAREHLGFGGIIVTDALNMAGAKDAAGGEGVAAVRAINAGCDALLYPDDALGVVQALHAAAADPAFARRCSMAAARLAAASAGCRPNRPHGAPVDVGVPADAGTWADDAVWADDIASRTLVVCRGVPAVGTACRLAIVDDDVGGPHPPPSRAAFADALRAAGVVVHEGSAGSTAPLVAAVFSDVRAWKGTAGLRPDALRQVMRLMDDDPDVVIVLFGHPRLAHTLPGRHILCAWGGDAIMQRASAGGLTRLITP